ncbi:MULTISPECIES: aldo/keto reductase [Vibrio]|nr:MULTISPECIES: aldo/keto reductase [Vibrio]EEX30751.1 aldo/keto reductase [Vibrio coralliilyticus ATCC BAA-450]MCM5509468.1 aldo/keto reductase [Vibrio sp. SCSIO 43169]MDE3899595.1 aldo/keto reductase [Vibrio sp. CC007]QFT34970.1 General stress protein 69 [Vibrio sp. THAF64]QGM32869.1 General stress protein 69 [Vibrio sp. THAF191d]
MKLSLGTVQFGLDYGVTNSGGQVERSVVEEMLDLAPNLGINSLDTAIAYGNSESVLGQFDLKAFKVTSKIPSLAGAKSSINQMTKQSLERLNIDHLYGMMLHDENDAFASNWRNLLELKSLKEEGLVSKIGVSFYDSQSALSVIEAGLVDLIQIPANLFDSRFEIAGVLDAAEKNGVEIHVRSLFLQGLLLAKPQDRPEKFCHFSDFSKYDDFCAKSRFSRLELALSYLIEKSQIECGVVGCTNVEQLEQIASAYNNMTKLDELDFPNFTSSNEDLLNPSKW